MKKTDKRTLTPKLRFPEFRDSPGWSILHLGKLCSIKTGKKDANEGAADGRYPFFTCAEDHSFSHSFSFDTEAILIAGNANVGQAKYYNGKFEAYQRTYVLADFSGIDVQYLYAYLAANLRPSLLSQVQTSAMSYIKLPMLQQYKVVLPPDVAEQQKIAECLSSLDELIAAEGRKLEALRAHKKGLMQQLFPQPGQTRPRLRFPEFRDKGEWVEDKLGSMCELYQPVTLSASELTMTGEYLVYGANGIIGRHDEYNHEESEIAVTCRGATCGEVTITKPKSWITGNAMVVKPRTRKLTKDFIFHYFKNHGLKSVISGSAQPQITRTGFAPLLIYFPTPEEQMRIAACLTTLDDLIAAQTQKLEALKTHKKGLMQQLFPSPEEVEA